MEWPLKRRPLPISKTNTWSLYYLEACPTPADPTIVWGSDVSVANLQAYLRQANAQSDVLISPAHVLVAAVGRCLRDHPEFNRRVVRRRVYNYRQINVLLPVQGGRKGPEVSLLLDVDRKPVAEIAREVWNHSRDLAKGRALGNRDERIFRGIPGILRGTLFRLMIRGNNLFHWPVALWGHRTSRAGTLINYLGHRGAPPMRFFKPSRFPNDAVTLNVTMGAAETGGREGPVAPIIVRADHRLVDANQLGQFIADVREYILHPEQLEVTATPEIAARLPSPPAIRQAG